jgi:hypothetical protein
MNDRGSWIDGWTSRFFVREDAPLTAKATAGLGRVFCRAVPPLAHFIPGLYPTYSVPRFLKRRCDRTYR